MTSVLLDELGGTAGVAATVDDLYRRLLTDAEVAHYFWAVDLRRVKVHMADFLVAALDGPDRYEGRDLAAAHIGMGITDAAFDSTVSHLRRALEARKIRPGLLELVLARIAPLRSMVVGLR